MPFTLSTLADSQRLGRLLAEAIGAGCMAPLLLRGELGSGKTTLAASIVRHLPGGAQAEAASPSFSICNFYPTMPPVLHGDLYRCKGDAPEEIWEFMDAGEGLVIIEWAEYLAPLPSDWLDIRIDLVNDKRLAHITAQGRQGQKLAARLDKLWRAAI